MLTVFLECRDNETELAHTLAALVPGAVAGLISDVIVLDGGSHDGSSRVADAAGCAFLQKWNLREAIGAARGGWIMLLEPGARPQNGWIEEIFEYLSLAEMPARFCASRRFRRPFFERLTRRADALELGLLMPRHQAAALAKPGMGLTELARVAPIRNLRSELIPARVIRESKPQAAASTDS
jgi:hypothetical protein